MSSAAAPAFAGDRFRRILGEFRDVGELRVVLGAPVTPDTGGLHLTELIGTRTRSLQDIRVRPGDGVGGKALLSGRPEVVNSYTRAKGITHAHDKAVSIEGLETVAALPIMVRGVPRMVVYVADHVAIPLGERWFGRFVPLLRRLSNEIAVEDEVARRLETLQAPETIDGSSLTRSDLLDIANELADLAGHIADDGVRARVERVRDRVSHGRSPVQPTSTGGLAKREIEVLEQVALGCNNKQVGDALGLSEGTVKSYLKNAMRKLHASNRVHAVRLARDAGIVA